MSIGCISYEEEDTSMSYEEEDTCLGSACDIDRLQMF
jgi:hypothetical protein